MSVGHEWATARFTGTKTCRKCGLLPLDQDDIETECPGDWVEVGELDEDSGDVGGDEQVGQAYSRRWQRRLRDGNWEVLTEYAYAAQLKPDEEPDVFDVTAMTESITCTDPEDPGSTEVDSDYQYEYVNHLAMTALEAAAYAKTYVKNIDISLYS